VSDSVDRNIAAEQQQPPPEEGEPQVTDHPEMTPMQRKVECIARRLRRAYFAQWDIRVMQDRGRTSNHTVKTMEKWRPLAEMLVRTPLCNPEAFMAYHFSGVKMPQVRNVMADTVMTDFQQFCRDAAAMYRTQLEIDIAALRFDSRQRLASWPEMSEEEAVRESLVDLTVKMTALFRYCAAAERGWTDIADKFHTLAMEELLVDPDGYKRTWGASLPQSLLEEADAQLNEVQ